jgi:hypothetical protein
MPESRTSEFSFQIPDDWKDRRVIAWSAQPGSGQTVVPNVLVTYDRLPDGTSINAFVDNQVGELMRGAKRFMLRGRRVITLDGRAGEEIVFQWDAGTGLLRQRQLYFALSDGRIITVVNTAADGEFDAAEEVFSYILNSFTWL